MIVGNPKESGADLAVALVNTWDTYDDPPEHLVELEDLRTFLRLVGRESAAGIVRERDLVEIKRLRDRLRRVFETDRVEEAAAVLNQLAAETSAVPRLEPHRGEWTVRYGPEEGVIAAHVGATAAAALIEIVHAHGITRFGTCGAPPCTGAFVDRTKNRSKRYCCELCADRAAQQQHRARLRRGRNSAG
jgi:predicted RNA-binding Zn ribbon-like protein